MQSTINSWLRVFQPSPLLKLSIKECIIIPPSDSFNCREVYRDVMQNFVFHNPTWIILGGQSTEFMNTLITCGARLPGDHSAEQRCQRSSGVKEREIY